MDTVSITGLIFISYFTRFIVIKYNLDPNIKYGHLFSPTPLSLLKRDNLLYVKCSVSYYNYTFGDKNPWIHFKTVESFANTIKLQIQKETIDLSREFKKFNSYKTTESFVNTFSYEQLMKNYENYNLQHIISKKELEELFETKKLNKDTEIRITCFYIESGVHDNKDVLIGLDENYKIYTYDTQVYSNYTFEYKKFFSVIFSLWIFFFVIHLESGFMLFSLEQYSIIFILLKTFQYNLFAYILLFLLLKKYLYKREA